MSDPQGQRLLAIDTSSKRGSLCIDWDGHLLHAELKDSRAHASDLLPELEKLLFAAGAERQQGALRFNAIIVGTGPGSYTGLRIGIATARALAWASGAELIGIPSFEALALGALKPGESAAIAQDARAGKFYYARYARDVEGDASLRELAAPQLLSADALADALREESLILGDGQVLRVAGLDEACAANLRDDAWPSATCLLRLGRARMEMGSSGPVEPLYLRAFGEK